MKMRHILLLVGLFPFLLVSCEEVIKDFSIQNADPQLVIEAQCSAQNDSIYVYISKTADYMNPVEYPIVTNAHIQLFFADTNILIPEIYPGTYAAHFNFPTNTAYALHVNINNDMYIAESFMHEPVPITNVSTSVFPYSAYIASYPDELFYDIHVFFQDPAETANFYRIKIWKNDTLLNNASHFIFFNDKLFNGKDYELLLQAYTFEEEDTIKIELMSIDKSAYEYYNTLEEAMTSTGNFSMPDNPKSNFTPSVLGYFMAYSSDTTTITIKADSISFPEYIL